MRRRNGCTPPPSASGWASRRGRAGSRSGRPIPYSGRPKEQHWSPPRSAHTGINEELFPRILSLHVPCGSVIADVPYSLGVFWKKVSASCYRVVASDMKPIHAARPLQADCRALPYRDAVLDCLVLDPPYLERPFRRTTSH